MFEILISFLKNTVEWRSWGWNLTTLTFLFTLLFTLIDGWGYKKQGETIWNNQSAESVSVITFVYSASFCCSYAIYSVFIGSIAILFNGMVLGYNMAPVIGGLFKFKRITRKEKIFCAGFVCMVPAMLLLPWKDQMFSIFMAGGLLFSAAQPLEMRRKQSSEDVDIRAMTVFALGTFFWAGYGFAVWAGYGFAVKKMTLALANSAAFFMYCSIILLWFRYRREPLTFRKFLLFFGRVEN
ncbi:MAG: hypothetical protein AAB474_00675 [Patescibacteria group bacterium]